MATENRTEYLETSKYLDAVYQQAAASGSSEAAPAEAEIDHHYVCFVKRLCYYLYELDGDREGPIRRNVLEQDEDVLSKKGRAIVQTYTQSELEGSFSLLALVESGWCNVGKLTITSRKPFLSLIWQWE